MKDETKDIIKNTEPIYLSTRCFLGKKDLVVSFYTEKCKYNCAFCDISTHSSKEAVSWEDINRQIDFILESCHNQLDEIEQLSIGNEGSILDEATFPAKSMDYMLDQLHFFINLETLSLETRPEYLDEELLRHIAAKANLPILDVTVGFETQSDLIRNGQLNKRISKALFEEKAALLGRMGIRLTAYVMLKPGFHMTEEEGVEEACATISYLYDLCKRCKTSLVIYLNPTYIAKNSRLKDAMELNHYKPPKIQSVLKVLLEMEKWHIPIYTGLNNENFSIEGGDYKMHSDFDGNILEAIRRFNKNQDYVMLHGLANQDNHSLMTLVTQQIKRLAGHTFTDALMDARRPISDYGLDSLGLTILLCRLERELGISFKRNLSVAEFNSIEAIMDRCKQELRG